MNSCKKDIIKHQGKIIGCALVFALIIAGILGTHYGHETTETVTIISINTKFNVSSSEGSASTTYEYLVTTDKGTFKIEPDGIFYSKCFGMLEVGKTYTVRLRGYSVPVLGMYPYIMETL